MEELRTEMRAMFHELSQQILQTLQTMQGPRTEQSTDTPECQQDDQPDEELIWSTILEDLPAAPPIAVNFISKNLQAG
jgi:hypothetical protein